MGPKSIMSLGHYTQTFKGCPSFKLLEPTGHGDIVDVVHGGQNMI